MPYQPSEVLNPAQTLKRRESEEEGLADPKKGVDKGNLPGPMQMSQAQFSGYDKPRNEAGLAKVLKNRK